MIQIPIEIGDVIRVGKFKNKRITVNEIGVDEYGLPTVNGKGIMKIRIEKLIPPKEPKKVDEDVKTSELKQGTEYLYNDGSNSEPVIYKGRASDQIHHIFKYKSNGGSIKLTKNNVFRWIESIQENKMSSNIAEGSSANNPKIQKVVDEINKLIESAIDSDGDPIGVIDTTSSWEEPYVYFPIEYKNGQLKITSKSQYKNKPEVDVILKRNMEYDGIPTLKNIAKMYKKAIRSKGSPMIKERLSRMIKQVINEEMGYKELVSFIKANRNEIELEYEMNGSIDLIKKRFKNIDDQTIEQAVNDVLGI